MASEAERPAADPHGDGSIVSRNPATLAVNDEIPEADPEDVRAAVRDAATAQPDWAALDVGERAAVLDRFRELLLERRESVGRTVAAETGKPLSESIGTEVGPVLNTVKFLTERGPDLLEESIPLGSLSSVGESTVVREPVGVVGAITPWNYPFGIAGSEVLPALFAGNAVVLKPAEETTLTAFDLRDLLCEAGLPADLLQVVPGRGSVTGQALAEADLDHLSFTGSASVGFELREACAARGVPTSLELGGSDPAIVLGDADVSLTADGITWARFANAGQSCAAVKRLYVHESIEAELTAAQLDRVEALRVGDWTEETVDVGPMITAEAVEELHAQVERSVEMGAEVLTGGRPIEDRQGHFYEPTLLSRVEPDMPVIAEETFGPVLPIVPVGDAEEAIERANDTDYGLTASVWTRDADRGEALARRLHAGTVTVNEHLYTFGLHATPWGGYGDSGGDFSHGRWGIESVTRTKHLHVAAGEASLSSGRFENLWWFPYGEDDADVLGRAMELMYGSGVATKLRNAPSVLLATIGNR